MRRLLDHGDLRLAEVAHRDETGWRLLRGAHRVMVSHTRTRRSPPDRGLPAQRSGLARLANASVSPASSEPFASAPSFDAGTLARLSFASTAPIAAVDCALESAPLTPRPRRAATTRAPAAPLFASTRFSSPCRLLKCTYCRCAAA